MSELKLNGRYRILPQKGDDNDPGRLVTVVTLADRDGDYLARPDDNLSHTVYVRAEDVESVLSEPAATTDQLRQQIADLQAELNRRTEPLILARLSPLDYFRVFGEYRHGLLEMARVADGDMTVVAKLTRADTVALARHLISVASITPAELAKEES